MADLLVELVGEEIPARRERMAARRFANAVQGALDGLGVWTGEATINGLCGPRHLAIYAIACARIEHDYPDGKQGRGNYDCF